MSTLQVNNITNVAGTGLPSLNGSSPEIKCQRNALTVAITNSQTNIAELAFNNLTVGNIYRVTVQILSNTTGYARIFAKHDGNTILITGSDPTNASYDDYGSSIIFKATATSVTFDSSVVSGTIGLSNRTWTMIEELPYHTDPDTTTFFD